MQNLEAPVSRDSMLGSLDPPPRPACLCGNGVLDLVAPSIADLRGVSYEGDHALFRSTQSLDLHKTGFSALCLEESRESVIVHVRSGEQGNKSIGRRICNRMIFISSESLVTSSAILYWLQALTNGSTRWQVSLSLSLIPSKAFTTEHLPSSLTPHAKPTPSRSSNKLKLLLHDA